MPTNLPPQYFEVEKKLKEARDNQEKIEILEEMYSIVPKHKGTDKLRALLRTKISKLKLQDQKKSSTAKQGPTFTIEKSGAGQIVLFGPPNSGKSALLKALTNAEPTIADYPFSTHTPSPAMMKFENIQIQLVDTPPVTLEFIDVWHTELIKSADAVLFALGLHADHPYEDLLDVMAKFEEKRVEFVQNSSRVFSSRQIPQDRILVVLNKTDLDPAGEKQEAFRKDLDDMFSVIAVSSEGGDKLEELRLELFRILKILRVYSKMPGKKPDLNDPYIFRIGSMLMDMAKAVHKDFAENLKFARIWGKDKYEGQKVNREYILQDEDIIELHL